YDLRMMLEAFAAQRAASRIGEARLNELTDLCGRMEALLGADTDVDKLAELNAEFHGIVREATRSTRLVAMLNAVVQLPLVMTTFHRYSPADLRRSAGHHRELVDALRARNETWAGSVMHSHVAAAKSVLLREEPSDRGSEE
ncbi:MAG: FCD domain-containing protein, partial [Actinophytocola sp.]|nr:FCD domain-containing protein [Actinophytocola sp.]